MSTNLPFSRSPSTKPWWILPFGTRNREHPSKSRYNHGTMTFRERIDEVFPENADGWRGAAGCLIRFIVTVGEHVDSDRVAIRASGLAFTSLLAIVPLTAVVISIFSRVRAFENVEQRVREFLIEQFVAASQAEVEHWIGVFSDGASRLGLFGFLFLLVTSIMLLNTIETNFNQIWRVAQHRTWVSRVTSYTSVLVLGSLFAGASLTLSARLQAILVSHGPLDPGIIALVKAWVIPFLLSTLAFLVAYMVVPNASVAFRGALTGAVVAGFLFEFGKFVIARTAGASVNLSILYGSMAVLPIFLIWLYYTWIIVLVGLEVAYTYQYKGAQSRPTYEEQGLEGLQLNLSLYLAIAAHFLHGQDPPTSDSLSRELNVPSDRIAIALRHLAEDGLVHRAGEHRTKQAIWIPASPPDRTCVRNVIKALTAAGSLDPRFSESAGPLKVFSEAGLQALGDRSVEDFLNA